MKIVMRMIMVQVAMFDVGINVDTRVLENFSVFHWISVSRVRLTLMVVVMMTKCTGIFLDESLG